MDMSARCPVGFFTLVAIVMLLPRPHTSPGEREWLWLLEEGGYSSRELAARRLRGFRSREVEVSLLRHALDPGESTGVVDACLGSLADVGGVLSERKLRGLCSPRRSDLSDCAQILEERRLARD